MKNLKIDKQLRDLIAKALSDLWPELKLNSEAIVLEHPTAEEHGDYATSVALRLQGQIPGTKSPREIAEKIVRQIDQSMSNEKGKSQKSALRLRSGQEVKSSIQNSKLYINLLEKVEVAGPGFINFWLAKEFFIEGVGQIKDKAEDSGKVDVGKKVKFSLEHTSPNTNKPLHIGHARNPILGMALVNILKKVNYSVVSTDINNDRGAPIMKSVWAYQKFGKNLNPEMVTRKEWDQIASKAKVNNMDPYMVAGKIKPDHLVGLFYVVGNALSDDDQKVADEIVGLVAEWEKGNLEVRRIWKMMNNWFYQGDKITLDRLGVYFDKEWYESEIYDKGKEIVLDGVKRGVFKKFDDGHVEAVLESFGMPNVVLLRSNGTALYITQDIELMRRRLVEDGNYYTYVQTSNEQNLRFKQLYKICEMLGYGKAEQFIHLGYGVVNTPIGKMSSRLGNVILLDDLLDTMVDLARGMMAERKIGLDYSASEKEEIAEAVGVGALKYAMLKVNPLMNITFDLERSVSLEGDSGPYLQYTYARARSVLRKAQGSDWQKVDGDWIGGKAKVNGVKTRDQRLNANLITIDYSLITSEEVAILRYLYRFPEVVEAAARTYSPNLICSYLFESAKRFNNLYNNCPILGNDLRLKLTEATSIVIANGLNLLGIAALERM